MSKIVVVGGGAAGLELVTRLGRGKWRQIILVEPSSHHYWKPRLHEIAAGTFDAELDPVNYSQHAIRSGYTYIQAEMTGLNRTSQVISLLNAKGESLEIDYDYLVICVGAGSNDFNTHGVNEHCLFLDSSHQALYVRRRINSLLRTQGKQRLSIVGAGATGVELAGELAKVSNKLKRYKNTSELDITLIEAADRILPLAPEKMSKKIHLNLLKQGVKIKEETRVLRAEAGKLITTEGHTISSDIQIWSAGIKCHEWLKDLDGLETNRLNQLKVRSTLQSTIDDRIFIIGDSSECPQPNGSIVPARAQAATQEACHLVDQLKSLQNGKSLKPFIYRDSGIVVSVGSDIAVGAFINEKLVLKGRLIRNVYDTIFRLHQRVIFGWSRVTALVVLKRIKGILNPYYNETPK